MAATTVRPARHVHTATVRGSFHRQGCRGPAPRPVRERWSAEVAPMPRTQQKTSIPQRAATERIDPDPTNAVVLAGRVSSPPTVRELPSGDPLVTFRISVPRSSQSKPARRVSDWFDCAVWGGRVLASCQGWQVGDVVEVRGELRRRHFQTPAGPRQRVEVAVASGRRVRRSASD